MNEDQLEDLKQFIDGKISQSETSIRDEIKNSSDTIRKEMSDGFAGVGDAIEETHNTTSSLDQRLTKLEQQSA